MEKRHEFRDWIWEMARKVVEEKGGKNGEEDTGTIS